MLDVCKKDVVWYEFEISTIETQWTVVKRYSDCSVFHASVDRLKLATFSKFAGPPVPSFPSKFHLGKQGSNFIEKRRLVLEQYFQCTLNFMQRLAIHAVGESTAPPYAAALRAAFLTFVEFLRSSSTTEVPPPDLTASSDPLVMQSRRDFGVNSINQPRVRCIKTPKRFTIAMLIPGVLLRHIYVDTTEQGDRVVTIGGCWNESIMSIEDVRDEAKSPKAAAVSSSPRDDAASGIVSDTTPSGSFEMLYEIPMPFVRSHWYSEYEAGVLFLYWDTP